MALYAIGDLHLSHGVDKPMDVFGGGWVNYIEKISNGFANLTSGDVCILCGDISWGMNLVESLDDFLFIERLPGKKIILKGNHDYWWSTAAKMKSFFDSNMIKTIEILQNNCFSYNDVSICGTRGWMPDDEFNTAQNEKITNREVQRLQTSLKQAEKNIKLCFFHYPPRTKNTVSYDIISVMNNFGVKNCYYGHLHADGHRLAVQGPVDGIEYKMVSADYINFSPAKILE